ncbi:mitochondrial ribosomal s18 [Pyrrhoderma noxium]|uniref:Small ribosomal subunit protein bS18m n=1 Tax=Pyrrhoderma noxium TaxID=2282107 RepID=A0A286UN15_9AGAM|nr:mitochondrial ribosomal s18 [Pyrrhoderma noxium]
MATKVTALARPFRRGIHSTACSRIASSSAPRYNSQNSDPDLTQSLQRDPASQSALQTTGKLTNILDSIVENSTQKDFGKRVDVFFEQGPLPPAKLNRANCQRIQNFRRPSIGPGREARQSDIFLQLGIDPRREVDNVPLLSSYVSRLGKIQPRTITGLTQRSQRLLGKAIKRAKHMGILPILGNLTTNSRIDDKKQRKMREED